MYKCKKTAMAWIISRSQDIECLRSCLSPLRPPHGLQVSVRAESEQQKISAVSEPQVFCNLRTAFIHVSDHEKRTVNIPPRPYARYDFFTFSLVFHHFQSEINDAQDFGSRQNAQDFECATPAFITSRQGYQVVDVQIPVQRMRGALLSCAGV